MTLTTRQRDVLAFLHLTGREPKYTHLNTTLAIMPHRTLGDFTLDGPWYTVKPESLPLIETRPLVKAVALFESYGFALPESYGERIARAGKRTVYLTMKRESDGVAVRIGKCGTHAQVDVDCGRAYPSSEYVCLTGKRAMPMPERVTKAPAALTVDEFDLLFDVVLDGERMARVLRAGLADDATPRQRSILKRLRALKDRGLIRAFNGNAYGRAESIALTPEGHRALNLRRHARREPDFDETVEEEAARLTDCTP